MAAVCNSIAVTQTALIYDSYWDNDIDTWIDVLSQSDLKDMGTLRIKNTVANYKQYLVKHLETLYDNNAKFIMVLGGGDSSSPLMETLTSAAACLQPLMSEGIGWCDTLICHYKLTLICPDPGKFHHMPKDCWLVNWAGYCI